jgi:ketosteroid isomerase-like protein
VVVEMSVRGVSEVSEVEVEQRFVFAFGVRDGKIAWGGLYRTRAEGLEAVGLRSI